MRDRDKDRISRAKRVGFTRQSLRTPTHDLDDQNPSPPPLTRPRVRPIYQDGEHADFRLLTFINLSHNQVLCSAT